MNQIINPNMKNHNRRNKHIPKAKKFQVEFGKQILEIPYNENLITSDSKNSSFKNFISKNKYKLQFFISSIIAISFLLFLFFKLYQNNQKEKLSDELLSNYYLTSLYSDNNQYNADKASSNTNVKSPFVIGTLKINKIQLTYPILSETNDDLLKISLCRFCGPLPNEVGNLCIAGHNYIDNRFFSRLNELEIGDVIELSGISNQKQKYHVYKIYEVDDNDLSCTKQDVGNRKILTLLTCDNSNSQRRLVIQAK